MSKADWVWMPHPGHFISSRDCKFFLNTYVNGYIVSTVGELWRKGDGYEEIGFERKYETMVFPGVPSVERGCCVYRANHTDGELDMEGYNDPREAYQGHLALCEKYDAMEPGSKPQ